MELGGVPADPYAGYIEDDSDLEYSGPEECSNDDSSDDAGNEVRTLSRLSDAEEEDEFEREMESEVIGLLALVTSPSALRVATARETTERPRQQRERGRGEGRRRRGESGVGGENSAVGSGSRSASDSKDRALVVHPEEPSVRVRPGAAGDELEEDDSRDGGRERDGPAEGAKKVEYYDEVYFDSSSDEEEREEEGGGGGGGGGAEGGQRHRQERRKVRKLTNDELFYDPNMDDEDERWVARQRMAYHNVKLSRDLEHQKRRRLSGDGMAGGEGPSSQQPPPPSDAAAATQSSSVPKSDAILSCPACMHTLCIDCQRHTRYTNQYRAMFVMNCCIVRDEVLRYAPGLTKKERKRRRGPRASNGSGEESAQRAADGSASEEFHPVRCSECNTEVAVIDKDEVFHFFNVLASAS